MSSMILETVQASAYLSWKTLRSEDVIGELEGGRRAHEDDGIGAVVGCRDDVDAVALRPARHGDRLPLLLHLHRHARVDLRPAAAAGVLEERVDQFDRGRGVGVLE